ncbi:MAG: hypothetical protein RML38_07625 [Bacteroidia bacterium]|nr:hypothetical protein [Bacteroidia bacterium]
MGVSLAALGSACCGLTVLRPTRPPPGYGVKGVGEGLRTKPHGLPSACLTQLLRKYANSTYSNLNLVSI